MGYKPSQEDGKHVILDMEACHRIMEKMGKNVDLKSGVPYVMSFVNCFPNTYKTTMVLNYAHYLRLIGHRVLVIDLDNKASISQYYLGDDEIIKLGNTHSVGALLTGESIGLESLIQKTDKHGVHIVPSCYELFNAELKFAKELFKKPDTEYWSLLKGKINTLPYDIVLIDTASTFNYLTVSAIVESKTVVIPSRTSKSSFQKLRKQIALMKAFYEEVALKANETPTVKFILTNEEPTSLEEEAVANKFMSEYGLGLYKQRIPYSEEINNANFHKRSIFEEESVIQTHQIKKTRIEAIAFFEEVTSNIYKYDNYAFNRLSLGAATS